MDFDTLLETVVDGVIVIDDKGNILEVNQSCLELFGYTKEELVGQNVSRLMPSNHSVQHDTYLSNFAKTGKAKIIGKGRNIIALRKNGTTFPARLSVGQASSAEKTKNQFVGIIHDSSRRLKAEESLDEVLRQFEVLTQTLSDCVIVIGANGIIRSINQSCCKIFGFTNQQLLGKNVSKLMAEPDLSQHDSYLEAYRKTGKAKIIGKGRKVVGRRADGSLFPLELSIGEHRTDIDHMFIGIMRDVSERETMREEVMDLRVTLTQVARASAVSEMGSALAHELNQPLSALMFYLSAAKKKIFEAGHDDKIVTLFDKAVAEAHRAGQIVGRIRKMVERTPLVNTSFDLNQTILETIEILSYLANKNAIVIQYHSDDKVEQGFGDRIGTGQVLTNVIKNAIDVLSNSDQGEISVRLLQKSKKHLISIADNGPGISQSMIETMFEPFKSSKEDGLGIGLSLSKNILEFMGGDIECRLPGRLGGAEFVISIPMYIEREEAV